MNGRPTYEHARSIFVGVANLVPNFKRMVSCSALKNPRLRYLLALYRRPFYVSHIFASAIFLAGPLPFSTVHARLSNSIIQRASSFSLRLCHVFSANALSGDLDESN